MAEINLNKEQKDKVRAAFIAFLEWMDNYHLEPIKLEQTVYDDRSAGTLDIVGYVDKFITVIDLKSSKSIYPEMRYQTAAYRYMWNQDTNNLTAVKNAVLRLDKETGFPEYRDFSKSYLKDLDIYQKMVDLFYTKHPKLAKNAGL